MPYLQFKGKTAVETHHHSLPHHRLDFDESLSVIRKGEKTSLEGNLIIEGDNLQALKALLPTHANRIKCVYFDPPYNTGNEEWVYNDNLKQPQFKEWIGQVVGKESDDACRHDKWCCMIYPRLQLFKELLRNDGVIFVSIDDNEVHHLRMLMDEVFDDSNFVADVTVVNNLKGRSDDQYIATAHEHLLVYRKSSAYKTYGLPLPEEYQDEYTERDENGEFYRLQGLRKRGSNSRREDRKEMFYPFYYNEKTGSLGLEKTDKTDIKILPKLSNGDDGCWRWGAKTAGDRMDELVARMVSGRNEYDVFQKDFLLIGGDLKNIKPKSFWLNSLHSTDAGTRIYKQIMGKTPFNNPKSPFFIMDILRQATKGTDIVLDATAGSGTTGHAVLKLNGEDEQNRQFILIQQPYDTKANETDKFNICRKVTLERVKRVIAGYSHTSGKGKKTTIEGLGGSFTYARVSEKPLFGPYRDLGQELPSYEEIAKYVFYTETSKEWSPAMMDGKSGKIGEHGKISYYLLYKPNHKEDWGLDLKFLKDTALDDPNSKLVIYCEKFSMHRDELGRWQEKNAKSVRWMLVPFNLK